MMRKNLNNTMKQILWVILLLNSSLAFSCNKKAKGTNTPVPQTKISRIEMMPNFPAPYKIIDWKQKAVEFDKFVFTVDTVRPAGSMIWFDNSQRNIPQETFGLYTAINDCRQGAKNNGGEFHESLNSLSAIMGAGLIGIDKTNQNGYNYL